MSEDPAVVRERVLERERVREERRFLFATVDQVFDKQTEAAAQQALLGHTVTVKGEIYRLDKFMGQGAFGVVYEAATPAGQAVIIKISHSFTRDLLNKPVPRGSSDETILETGRARNAVVESASLNRLSKNPAASSYFPHFYGAQLAPNPDRKPGEPDRRIAIQVVEFIDGADLHTMLQREKNLTQYPDYTFHLAQQLTLAVQRMHEANVLHLDLKPANIMIAKDGKPKIIDFGGAQLPDKQQVTAHGTAKQWARPLTGNFTSGYVTQSEKLMASQARDTYALGRIIQNLLYGRFTDATRNDATAFVAARQPHYEALPVNLKSLSVLADRMATENLWERITLAEAEHILGDLVTPAKVEAEDDGAYIIVGEAENNDLQKVG